MRARLLLAAAVACLAFSPRASGQAPKRLLVVDPLPKGAAERIAGQVADLPWTLEHVRAARRGTAMDTGVAEGLAREPGVGAVLWVEEDSGGFVLHLYDAEQHQVVERQLPRAAGTSPLARSAALEALALAVRSGLSALSAETGASGAASGGSASAPGGSGNAATTQSTATEQPSASTDAAEQHAETKPAERQHVKPPDSDSDSDSEPDSEPEPDSDSEPEPDSEPDAATDARSPTLILAAAWAAAIDGQSPIQHGPSARLGVAFDRLELALEGQLALPADVQDNEIRIDLQRSVALVSASWELVQANRARLAISAGAGIASFARDTRRVATGLRATAADDVQTFAAELELRGRLRLLSSGTVALDLELGAGVLALPAAPTLRYEGTSGRVEHALWAVQPQLRLGPVLSLSL
jgi:hypothetical protein